MKKLKLRKEKKNHTTELNEKELREIQEKIKGLYNNIDNLVVFKSCDEDEDEE